MEENIALLIADLSGYTALTEAHGAASAADLIDKYLEIVACSLVGDSTLKERTGDEVMIVSSLADDLLATAFLIMENTSSEENFLQIHGGLHYGKVLARNNSYFGTTINLTSRIAAKARPGTFWCSKEFIEALSQKSTLSFNSRGNHRFKNISERKEVFELNNGHTHSFLLDPVCKMLILDRSLATQHPEQSELFFCSAACLKTYESSQHETALQ